jgi:hypothetical protein
MRSLVVPGAPEMTPPLNNALTSANRLRALRRTELLDSQPETDFDRVTQLASRLMGGECHPAELGRCRAAIL